LVEFGELVLAGVDMLAGVLVLGVLAFAGVVLFPAVVLFEVLFDPEFAPLLLARGSESHPIPAPITSAASVTQSKIGLMCR
jgi:hypothetical protein